MRAGKPDPGMMANGMLAGSAPTSGTDTLYTHVGIEVARPPAVVWDVVTDYATDTVWRKGITEMAPDREGSPMVGTHVREVLHLGGREYVTDTTVTEVGPGTTDAFAGAGTSGVVRGAASPRGLRQTRPCSPTMSSSSPTASLAPPGPSCAGGCSTACAVTCAASGTCSRRAGEIPEVASGEAARPGESGVSGR